MPPITQEPLGHGRIVWLGINKERGTFSTRRDTLTIHDDGIEGDMYRGMWREISGHDTGYIATDGVAKGDKVLNMRQITLVDAAEVNTAAKMAGVHVVLGMLRENIVVSFTPQTKGERFSKLPPQSRMVIGTVNPKVLNLTEENGPCRTISRPIAVHYGDVKLADKLREALVDKRGLMAMVRSWNARVVHIGDTFTVFPPMT